MCTCTCFKLLLPIFLSFFPRGLSPVNDGWIGRMVNHPFPRMRRKKIDRASTRKIALARPSVPTANTDIYMSINYIYVCCVPLPFHPDGDELRFLSSIIYENSTER